MRGGTRPQSGCQDPMWTRACMSGGPVDAGVEPNRGCKRAGAGMGSTVHMTTGWEPPLRGSAGPGVSRGSAASLGAPRL